jgi:hypothetical protein
MLTASNEFVLVPCLTKSLSAYAKFELQKRIMSDIVVKKTTLGHADVQDYRVNKLLNAGWAIQGSALIAVKEVPEDPDDICFVCLKNFENNDNVNLKMACCHKLMHNTCARNWLTKSSHHHLCPHCGVENGFHVCSLDRKLVSVAVDASSEIKLSPGVIALFNLSRIN